MNVLFLASGAKLRAGKVEGWLRVLGVDDVVPFVVAFSEPSGRRIAAQRVITLPRTLRRGGLPVDQPLRGRPRKNPVYVEGGRVRRWAERNAGRRVDSLLSEISEDRVKKRRATLFARGCLRSDTVRALFAEADLVVAVDSGSAYAAWRLAREYDGPAVVYGLAGAAETVRNTQGS